MPQMAPSSWIMLFLWASIMIITYMSLNYFIHYPQFNGDIKMNKNYSIKSLIWKW